MCICPSSQPEITENERDLKAGKHCTGHWSLCISNLYLLSKGYVLAEVMDLDEELKEPEVLQHRRHFWKLNGEPIGIILSGAGHRLAFRKIIPERENGEKVEDQGIWMNLDSAKSPEMLGAPFEQGKYITAAGHASIKKLTVMQFIYDQGTKLKLPKSENGYVSKWRILKWKIIHQIMQHQKPNRGSITMR